MNQREHRRIKLGRCAVVAAVAGISLIAGACGSGGSSAGGASEASASGGGSGLSAASVKVALGGGINDGAIYWDEQIAEAQGFFKKNGLDVSFINAQGGGPDTVKAVQAGSAQFGSSATDAPVNGIDSGAKLKIIAAGQKSVLAVLGGPDVTTFDGLRGKKVAVTSLGAGSSLLLKKVLEKHGLDFQRDVKPVLSQATPQRVAALESGAVGATIAGPPDMFIPLKHGAHLLQYTQDAVPFMFICHFVSSSFAQEHPDTVKAYVRAIQQAHAWMTDPGNERAAEQILQQYTKIDAPTVHKSYQTIIGQLKAIPADAGFTVAEMKQDLAVLGKPTGSVSKYLTSEYSG